MDWYALVKRYYNSGCYTTVQVQVFVTAGKITAEQATELSVSKAAYSW